MGNYNTKTPHQVARAPFFNDDSKFLERYTYNSINKELWYMHGKISDILDGLGTLKVKQPKGTEPKLDQKQIAQLERRLKDIQEVIEGGGDQKYVAKHLKKIGKDLSDAVGTDTFAQAAKSVQKGSRRQSRGKDVEGASSHDIDYARTILESMGPMLDTLGGKLSNALGPTTVIGRKLGGWGFKEDEGLSAEYINELLGGGGLAIFQKYVTQNVANLQALRMIWEAREGFAHDKNRRNMQEYLENHYQEFDGTAKKKTKKPRSGPSSSASGPSSNTTGTATGTASSTTTHDFSNWRDTTKDLARFAPYIGQVLEKQSQGVKDAFEAGIMTEAQALMLYHDIMQEWLKIHKNSSGGVTEKLLEDMDTLEKAKVIERMALVGHIRAQDADAIRGAGLTNDEIVFVRKATDDSGDQFYKNDAATWERIYLKMWQHYVDTMSNGSATTEPAPPPPPS